MALTNEVGLRLLFSPVSSNIVVRTACCTVGTILPVYSTFKAIENNNQTEQRKWLLYWTVYGSFTVAEVFSDKILSWFPLYYHAKFAFLVWLQLPSSNGAEHLYTSYLRPLLLRHQAKLDKVPEFIYREMTKIINAHQTEIKFAKALFMKLVASVHQIVWDFNHPVQTPRNRSIGGPRQVDSSHTQSNIED
ncbi:HVA22-like protein k [Hibiscus syriacus]|uniref:HVA22-like protein n=1 Tax=Hibiscus syriacus TaxID=106335 RepID=A0A6A2XXB5_HIBSY|nr:HVA22-like protein k [Hibiscus syriacus]KAE8660997.1 HVA22-like protein k [Hibiscus syriacus]